MIRYKNRTFNTYTTADGLLGNQVVKIRLARKTLLLVHTGKGVAQWNGERFLPYTANDPLFASLSNGPSAVDADGGLWTSDRAGFYRWTPTNGRATYQVSGGLPDVVHIQFTYRDQQGAIWIGASAAGVFKLQDDSLTRVHFIQTGVNGMCEDRDGRMWLATAAGLVRYENGTITTYTTRQGLSADHLLTVYEDREGNLWLGSAQGGLNVLRNQIVTVLSTENGLASNNAYPIIEDREGGVWVGTWPGLNRYKDGKFTPVLLPDGSPYDRPSALLQDSNGDVWVGTYGGGARRITGGVTQGKARVEVVLPDGVVVHVIYQDRAGAIWFGTAGGLIKFEKGILTTYTTRDGLPHDRITAILETRDNTLWCGTRAGLVRFKDGRFTSYGEAQGLSGEHVRTIYEDAEGILWIGSYDGGLTRIKNGVITQYKTKDGLFDYGVFQILEDSRGEFWISCNRGIYRVSRRELNDFAEGRLKSITSISYGRRDGLTNLECNGGNQPAGVKTRDGRLWFSTQGGVAVIDPNRVKTADQPPPVLLEQVVINDEPSHPRDAVRILPGQEVLEIQYTGISLTSPEQVNFRYKLEGLDADWTSVGTRRSAYYSHLPPGDYTFRVVAANRDGVWNTQGASIKIIVVPPFWRTWWFLLLGLLGLAGIVVMLYYRRISGLQKAHAAQETFSRKLIASQEHERARIAAELHDSLGQNLLIIKNRAFMLRNRIADHNAALAQADEISATASLAVEEVREIARNLRPYQIDRLGLTLALKDILKKISDSSPIEFKWDIQPLDGLLSSEAEINLYRIVQEAVNNIIKHSAATQAQVQIKRQGRRLLVRIADNGRGFTAEAADNLQNGDGFGLASIRERARILGGVCAINSAPGQGTVIQITVDLPDESPAESHNGRIGK